MHSDRNLGGHLDVRVPEEKADRLLENISRINFYIGS